MLDSSSNVETLKHFSKCVTGARNFQHSATQTRKLSWCMNGALEVWSISVYPMPMLYPILCKISGRSIFFKWVFCWSPSTSFRIQLIKFYQVSPWPLRVSGPWGGTKKYCRLLWHLWFARSVPSRFVRKRVHPLRRLQVRTLLAAQPQNSQGRCDDTSVTRPENGELCGSPDQFRAGSFGNECTRLQARTLLAAQPQNSQGMEPNPLSENLSKILL